MAGFWLLAGISAVSKVGNTFLYFAVPISLLATTHSVQLAVLSLGIQSLPYGFSPLLGSAIDRYDRRLVFFVSELSQAGFVCVLSMLLATQNILATLLCLVALGTASAASNVTSDFALIPSMVPEDRVQWAYSRYSSLVIAARLLGPALAGGLIGELGASRLLWLDALTFLFTAGTALFLPKKAAGVAIRHGWMRALRDGIRYLQHNRRLKLLALVLALYNLGAGGLGVALIVLSRADWHLSSRSLGAALSVGAVFGLAGSWMANRGFGLKPLEVQIGWWLVCCALGASMLVIGGAVASFAGYYAVSLGEGGMNVTTMRFRHRVIEAAYIGRANSLIRSFVYGAIPLSSIVLGYTCQLPRGFVNLLPATVPVIVAAVTWLVVSANSRLGPVEAVGQSRS